MNFKLSKDATISAIGLGSIAVVIGTFLSWPLQFNSNAVIDAISPLVNTWWRLLLLFLAVGAIAFTLAKKNHIALAEYVGTIANFVLLAPLLVVLAGLPKDIGWVAILLFFGAMTLILSVSALISIATFQVVRR